MEEIKLFWNLVHYKIVILEKVAHKLISMPILLFLDNEFVRKIYAKVGVKNASTEVRNATSRDYKGSSSYAPANLGFLLTCFVFSILNIIVGLSLKSFLVPTFIKREVYFIGLILLSVLISIVVNRNLVFRKKKYKKYFEKFKLRDKRRSLKDSFFVFMFICFDLLFVIFSVYLVS